MPATACWTAGLVAEQAAEGDLGHQPRPTSLATKRSAGQAGNQFEQRRAKRRPAADFAPAPGGGVSAPRAGWRATGSGGRRSRSAPARRQPARRPAGAAPRPPSSRPAVGAVAGDAGRHFGVEGFGGDDHVHRPARCRRLPVQPAGSCRNGRRRESVGSSPDCLRAAAAPPADPNEITTVSRHRFSPPRVRSSLPQRSRPFSMLSAAVVSGKPPPATDVFQVLHGQPARG